MKSLLCCLLIFCLGLSLSACGKKEPALTLPTAEDMAVAVEASGGFTELTALSPAQIARYLNIDESDFTEAAMYMDASRSTPEAIIVLTSGVPNAGKGTEWLATTFEDYQASILEEYRDYQPGEVPKIESAVRLVQGFEKGTQGVMVIGGTPEAVEQAVTALWTGK